MISRTLGVLAGCALVATAAHAMGRRPAAEPQGERECFQLASVSGFSNARNNRVHIHAGPSRTFEFQTLGPCPDLGWSEGLALDPATAGPICRGMDVDLIVPSAIGPRRCPISMIRRLEPGERPAR